MFCSPFDEALASEGPAAVFLPDPEGLFRFDARWTRDAWGRAPGPHTHGLVWLLLRDRGTGFVTLALVSSPTLIPTHPRQDIRSYATREQAEQARAAFGWPPIAEEPW